MVQIVIEVQINERVQYSCEEHAKQTVYIGDFEGARYVQVELTRWRQIDIILYKRYLFCQNADSTKKCEYPMIFPLHRFWYN